MIVDGLTRFASVTRRVFYRLHWNTLTSTRFYVIHQSYARTHSLLQLLFLMNIYAKTDSIRSILRRSCRNRPRQPIPDTHPRTNTRKHTGVDHRVGTAKVESRDYEEIGGDGGGVSWGEVGIEGEIGQSRWERRV